MAKEKEVSDTDKAPEPEVDQEETREFTLKEGREHGQIVAGEYKPYVGGEKVSLNRGQFSAFGDKFEENSWDDEFVPQAREGDTTTLVTEGNKPDETPAPVVTQPSATGQAPPESPTKENTAPAEPVNKAQEAAGNQTTATGPAAGVANATAAVATTEPKK